MKAREDIQTNAAPRTREGFSGRARIVRMGGRSRVMAPPSSCQEMGSRLGFRLYNKPAREGIPPLPLAGGDHDGGQPDHRQLAAQRLGLLAVVEGADLDAAPGVV